jgi:hypothetical protein
MTHKNIKLDFVIIGRQKCGSKYLQTVINNHPEVNMAPGEVTFIEIADYKNSGLEKQKERLSNLGFIKEEDAHYYLNAADFLFIPRTNEFNSGNITLGCTFG